MKRKKFKELNNDPTFNYWRTDTQTDGHTQGQLFCRYLGYSSPSSGARIVAADGGVSAQVCKSPLQHDASNLDGMLLLHPTINWLVVIVTLR